MTGSPPSGFSSVDLDRWRAATTSHAALTDGERRQLAGPHTIGSGPDDLEVLGVYAGVVDLIALSARSAAALRASTADLLGRPASTGTFVICVAGSVAVGKSTVARVLRTLIERWPSSPRVEIVSTDAFLRPNSELDHAGLSMQKGFPVSYDTDALIDFLVALRGGATDVSVPVYSHVIYDVVPGESQRIERADVVILEGVNVLQAGSGSGSGQLVSDHLDLSVYVDAAESDIEQWFVDRFAALRNEEHTDERAFYRQFATLSDEESEMVARWTWREINLVNLRAHIAPTRDRADLVLVKGADHRIGSVLVRDR